MLTSIWHYHSEANKNWKIRLDILAFVLQETDFMIPFLRNLQASVLMDIAEKNFVHMNK